MISSKPLQGRENKAEIEDMQLPYGRGSITKRTRRTKRGLYTWYQGTIYLDGVKTTITAKTENECRKKLTALRKSNSRQVKTSYTFVEWMLHWYEVYKKPVIEEGQQNETLRYIESYFKPYFKNTPLRKINTEYLQKFMNSFDPEKNRRNKAIFGMLKAAVQKAYATQQIRFDYSLALSVKFEDSEKKRAYEFTEQDAIIKALPPKYAATFFFLCCTGMRISEFLVFTKDDIDYDRMTLHINKARKRSGKTGKTKTKTSFRQIPFCEELFEMTYALNGSEDFFGTVTYNGLKKQLQRLLAKLNITGVSVIHSTRHTFSSVCYFLKFPDLWIKEAMGHSTLAMTLDTYTNLLDKGNSPVLQYLKILKTHI